MTEKMTERQKTQKQKEEPPQFSDPSLFARKVEFFAPLQLKLNLFLLDCQPSLPPRLLQSNGSPSATLRHRSHSPHHLFLLR
jgi:hypothetical protein